MDNHRKWQIFRGVIAALIGAIYLINPTAGLLELIPDFTPFIGNLDEAGATTLLLYGINEMRGVSVTRLLPKK